MTGAHSMKVGYQGAYLIEEVQDFSGDTQLTYGFFGGNPSSVTMRIAPWQISNRTAYAAFYAQDQWTMGRLSLQGALRYDHAWSWFPAEHNGAPVASQVQCRADHLSLRPTASTPTTTSRLGSVSPTTCSATARRRSG